MLLLARIELSDRGEVPERSNGAVSKTVVPLSGDRGFESLPLRQNIFDYNGLVAEPDSLS